MGNQTLGSTATPTGGTYYINSSYVQWKANSYAVMPAGGGYVDVIYCYCGAYSTTQGFQFAIYAAGGDAGSFINSNGPYNYGVGYGWNSGAFTPGSYPYVAPGTNVSASFWTPGASQIQGTNFGTDGSFWFHTGTGWVEPFSGGTQVTAVGDLAWYLTYFQPAAITSYPTAPVQPGSSFSVSGVSFSPGVNSVSIGGVACPSWTVNSDTSLTVTAPSSGCQGQLEVVTNAGIAYSSGNMIAGQIWVSRGGVVTSPISIFIPNGGGVQSVKGVWVSNGSGGVKRIW